MPNAEFGRIGYDDQGRPYWDELGGRVAALRRWGGYGDDDELGKLPLLAPMPYRATIEGRAVAEAATTLARLKSEAMTLPDNLRGPILDMHARAMVRFGKAAAYAAVFQWSTHAQYWLYDRVNGEFIPTLKSMIAAARTALGVQQEAEKRGEVMTDDQKDKFGKDVGDEAARREAEELARKRAGEKYAWVPWALGGLGALAAGGIAYAMLKKRRI